MLDLNQLIDQLSHLKDQLNEYHPAALPAAVFTTTVAFGSAAYILAKRCFKKPSREKIKIPEAVPPKGRSRAGTLGADLSILSYPEAYGEAFPFLGPDKALPSDSDQNENPAHKSKTRKRQ